jgi:hypothetical protein
MREQRARGVELAAVDDHVVARVGPGGLEVDRAFRAELGEGVAEARVLQRLGEEQPLLRLVGDGADRGDDAEMVLRDLAEGGIRLGDDRDHPVERDVGKLRPAIGLGHVDRPEAALGKRVELGQGPDALAVALRGALSEFGGEVAGDGDGFVVGADDVGRLRRARNRGHGRAGFGDGTRVEGHAVVSLTGAAERAFGAPPR